MQFETKPQGPFSLTFARESFGGLPGLGSGPGAALVNAFPVEGWQGSAAVTLTCEEGVLRGEVFGTPGLEERAWAQALSSVSADFDGRGFAEVGARDPVAAKLLAHFQCGRPVCNTSPYEGAIQRVLSHRSSIVQARRIRLAMARGAGDRIRVDHRGEAKDFWAFPRPQVLLQLKAFKGVSGQKLGNLHALAEAALLGTLDRSRLRALPLDQALRQLREIRGVGRWTSQGIVLRGAGVCDEIPDDEATAQAVQFAYQLPRLPPYRQVCEMAEAWRPFRMWVVVLLHMWLRTKGPGPRRGLSAKAPTTTARLPGPGVQ